MDILLLYLFTRLDALHTTVVFLFIICFFILVILVLVHNDLNEEYKIKSLKSIKRVFIIGLIGAFLAIVIPRQQDAAFILAGYGVLEVVRSDVAKRLAGKSVELIEQTLDGYLKKEKQ